MTDQSCPACGTAISPNDRFCAGCGARALFCRGCGQALGDGVRFCPSCGASQTDPGGAGSEPRDVTGEITSWDLVVRRLRAATKGEFDIKRELGRGGMAAVYLAHEIALDRFVALKVMSPGLMTGAGMIERFRQEAITVAKLSHPNIVTIHRVRQIEDIHFFVMKYAEGRSLESIIRDVGPLPFGVVRAIVFQIGTGLAYAHRRGIIHRDVKPANVLFDEDGNAIVTDFGIAKVAESTAHTQTGAVFGTPAYMSPEQCFAAPLTWSSDLYSLGIVTYQMLTGKVPFSGGSFAVMQGHTAGVVPPIRDSRTDCPLELEWAVMRMLAKRPPERWATMGEALNALGASPLSGEDPIRVELARLAEVDAGQRGVPVEFTPSSPLAAREKAARTPTPIPPVPPVPVATIREHPGSVETGETIILTATSSAPAGSSAQTMVPQWASSDASIASIDAQTGAVTGIKPGVVSLSVRIGELTTTTQLSVTAAAPTAIDIAAGPDTIEMGDDYQLAGAVRDRRGVLLAMAIAWSSSDSAVATASTSGTVFARKPGQTVLTARAADVTATITLSVVRRRVHAVRITEVPPGVDVNESVMLRAVALDKHGAVLFDRSVQWASSDPRRATVSPEGMVRGLKPGTVTISATADTVSAISTLEVFELPAPPPIVMAPPAVVSAPVAATLPPPADAPRPRVEAVPSASHPPSSHPIAAPTAPSGSAKAPAPSIAMAPAAVAPATRPTPLGPLATAAESGIAAARRRRRLMLVGGGVGVLLAVTTVVIRVVGSGTTETVNPTAPETTKAPAAAPQPDSPPATQVETPAPASPAPVVLSIVGQATRVLPVGDTLSVRATVTASGRALPNDAEVLWRVENPAIASVDPRRGLVTGVGAGRTSIIAERVGARPVRVALTVRQPQAARIELEPTLTLHPGERTLLRPKVTYDRGRKGPPAVIAWDSDHSNIASVTPAGELRALAVGNAVVTAHVDGLTSRLTLTVTPSLAAPTPQPRIAPQAPSSAPQPTVPAPVTTSPTAPPKGSTTAAAPAPSLDDATIQSEIAALLQMLRGKNAVRVEQLYANGDAADAARRADLLQRVRAPSALDVSPATDISRIEVTPKRARFQFVTNIQWKNNFSPRKFSADPVFEVTLDRDGERWRVASFRIANNVSLR